MMSKFISEQRNDIRVLNSLKSIVESGNLSKINELLEKRRFDPVLINLIEKSKERAISNYIESFTGGKILNHKMISMNDISDHSDFGKNYWSKTIEDEIELKRSLIVERESRSLSLVYG